MVLEILNQIIFDPNCCTYRFFAQQCLTHYFYTVFYTVNIDLSLSQFSVPVPTHCPSSWFYLKQAQSRILRKFLGVNSLVWIMQLLREVNLGGGAGFWEDIVHNVLSTSFLLDLSSINTTRLVDTNPQSFTLTKELTSSKPNYVTLLSNR